MVEMGDAENDSEFGAQFVEQIQQTHGIGAAGYSHGHAIASTKILVRANLLQQTR
jgi:hypothetical protein